MKRFLALIVCFTLLTTQAVGSEELDLSQAVTELYETSEPRSTQPENSEESLKTDLSWDYEFEQGYARLNAETEVQGYVLAKGTVVYAFDRTLEDDFSVAFEANGEAVLGVLPAALLEAAEASEAVLSEMEFFDAERTIPLPVLFVAVQENAGQETHTVVQSDAEKEIDPAPEKTDADSGLSDAQVGMEQEIQDPAESEEDSGKENKAAAEDGPTGEQDLEKTDGISGTEGAASASEGEETVQTGAAVLTLSEETEKEAEEDKEEEENPIPLTGTVQLGVGECVSLAWKEWTASDPTVLSVTGNVVSGLAPGYAELTDGVSERWAVEVMNAPESVGFSGGTLWIGQGEWYTLEPILSEGSASYRRAWATSAKKYVTVSNGTIHGVKAGTSVISVRTYNGKYASVKVTVKKAPSKVYLSASRLDLGEGENAQLSAWLPSGTAGAIGYYSADESIVTVDAGGKVHAVSEGTTLIAARTYNGKAAYCSVTVGKAPEELTLEDSGLSVAAGDTKQLRWHVNEGSLCAQVPTFEVEDATIAEVSAAGVVRGLCEGSTQITAITYNGVKTTAEITVTPAPTMITLPAYWITLGLGESLRLTPEADAPVEWFAYSTSNKKYVTVNGSGVIRGARRGSAKITIRTYNGVRAVVNVTVKKAPKKISIGASRAVLGVGESSAVWASYPSGTGGGYSLYSDDPTIASVENGRMQANAVGVTRVWARSYNGKKAAGWVTVRPEPSEVILSEKTLRIGVGQTVRLSAGVNEGSAGEVTFSAADGSIAAASADGWINGRAVGDTKVTGTAYNDVSADCDITVVAAPEWVTLPYGALTIGVGEWFQLQPSVGDSVGGYGYATSNKKYVAVNGAGWIKGVKAGSAWITVTTYNGKKTSVKVTVRKAPSKVSLNAYDLNLYRDQEAQLYAYLPSGTGSAIEWISSDPEIAEVENGRIITKGVGTVYITARSFNGKTATCTVRVWTEPDSLELEPGLLALGEGQQAQLKAILPEDSYAMLSWSSSDPLVAAVDGAGNVRAVGPGSAFITVKAGLIEAQAQVNVWAAPSYVTLDALNVTMGIDEAVTLKASVPEGSEGLFTWSSSNPSVAEVDDAGNVFSHMCGTTWITVRTYNGKTASALISVSEPHAPQWASLNNQPDVLKPGNVWIPECSFEPEDAKPYFVWKSSNESVAVIDRDNGMLEALAQGFAVITVSSRSNPKLVRSFTIAVQNDKILALPERRTDASRVSANLAKINAIRECTINEIDTLQALGKISASDANTRRNVINNGFKDYGFAWTTSFVQKYWKAANSEGGAKDFKPGIVYYGMPYTQYKREYNFTKAVSEKRFVAGGVGYTLNKNGLISGNYCGNDCSSFLSAAIWGVNSSKGHMTTKEIASTVELRKINFADLRPGDVICASGRHCLFFLYFVDDAHTQIMVLQNGGSEAGLNTVNCSLGTLGGYMSDGYSAYRLKGLP